VPSISVRDLDGRLDERTVPEGTTAAEVFPERSTVVPRVGDVLRHLSYVLAAGDVPGAGPLDPSAPLSEPPRRGLRSTLAASANITSGAARSRPRKRSATARPLPPGSVRRSITELVSTTTVSGSPKPFMEQLVGFVGWRFFTMVDAYGRWITGRRT